MLFPLRSIHISFFLGLFNSSLIIKYLIAKEKQGPIEIISEQSQMLYFLTYVGRYCLNPYFLSNFRPNEVLTVMKIIKTFSPLLILFLLFSQKRDSPPVNNQNDQIYQGQNKNIIKYLKGNISIQNIAVVLALGVILRLTFPFSQKTDGLLQQIRLIVLFIGFCAFLPQISKYYEFIRRNEYSKQAMDSAQSCMVKKWMKLQSLRKFIYWIQMLDYCFIRGQLYWILELILPLIYLPYFIYLNHKCKKSTILLIVDQNRLDDTLLES